MAHELSIGCKEEEGKEQKKEKEEEKENGEEENMWRATCGL